MTRKAAQSHVSREEARLHQVDGVVVYARKDENGKPTVLDAVDTDERKIRRIADRLWRRGFGVMRQRNPRAGKTYYLFKATWTGPGEPPEDPFEDDGEESNHWRQE
jgi:hypothetical protein